MSRRPDRNSRIDWARLYEICVGMIGIQPNDFWQMSLQEIYLAIAGFKEFNGVQDKASMTTDELETLMELHPD